MSYEKAMRHARNRRKGRNMYLGFDTGSGQWPSVYAGPMGCFARLNDEFKRRHRGDRDQARAAISLLLQQCREHRDNELEPDLVTIRVPPSYESARQLSGQWHRFEHFGGALSSERAQHMGII